MKKTSLHITSLMIAIISIAAYSCSGIDYPQGIDRDVINKLKTTNATYQSTNLKYFDKPDGSKKWKEFDASSWDGLWPATPNMIVFHNGKVLTPLVLFSSAGPNPLCIPWEKYVEKTGKKLHLYIGREVDFNESNNTIVVGDNEYDLLKFKANEIVISSISSYITAGTDKGGERMEWRYYAPVDHTDLDEATDICFSSKREAYQFIIDRCRETFGDKLPISPNTPNEQVIDFDLLQQRLDNSPNPGIFF